MSTSLLSESRDPWVEDFDALREAVKDDLPSLMETRQLLLASSRSDLEPIKEGKLMSLIRQKPLVSALVLVLAMLALVPGAYAVVNRLFLTVDPEQSEEQIKESLEQQLSAAGLSEAEVEVEKNGYATKISISAYDAERDQALDPDDIQVDLGGHVVDSRTARFAVAIACELSAEDQVALTELVASEAFTALTHRPDDLSDAEYAASLAAFFDENGFPDVDVVVEGDRTQISVRGGHSK